MTPSLRAINLERQVKLVFFLISIILLFLIVLQVDNLLVSFLLAFSSYYLFAPMVDYLERRGLSRVLAAATLFLSLGAIIAIFIALFTPALGSQINDLQNNFPKYIGVFNDLVDQLEQRLGAIISPLFPEGIHGKLHPRIGAWAAGFLQLVPDYISKSFAILFLAPFLTFFMLLDGRRFIRSWISMVPNNFFELALNLTNQISSQMGGFIRARLLESIIVGILIWMGLLVINFPYALVLAIISAIMNIIPYVGPILGAAPAFIISFSHGGPAPELAGLAFIFVGVQVVDAVVLVPFLVAKIVDLHPVVVILAILIGSQVMGVIGMIICIPVASALKVTLAALYRHFTDFRT